MITERVANEIETGSRSSDLSSTSNTARPIDSSRFYQPGLDVLRCVAFFLVLAQHLLPKTPHVSTGLLTAFEDCGNAGVCLFFTLSAFLITSLLIREHDQTGTIHLPAFYIRRILRIWPLYFFMILAGVVFPHLYRGYPPGGRFVIPYLLMFGNWVIVLHGATKNTILAPLWSISVEEQFYVIWPTLFFYWQRRGLIFAAIIFLPIAWITDYVYLFEHDQNQLSLWCNSLSQFQFFALGGALAILMSRRTLALKSTVRYIVCAVGLGFFLIAAASLDPHSSSPNVPSRILGGYFMIDLGCVLLLLAFYNARISHKFNFLTYLGKISYGLYVFHLVILGSVAHFVDSRIHLPIWMTTSINGCLTLALVVPLAALSYEYFEKPFLKLKDRFTFVPSRST